MRVFRKNGVYSFTAIIMLAILLILPQLVSRQMIVGSDALFHFNRVYDAGMQLKEHNFQYFISMYGFQQSARIILPFYGPIMTYLHGVIFLLSPTWFHYQLVSNFILYVLAGVSMACLLKKLEVPSKWGTVLSLLFMTTFSIQYWILRQGFSAWGAALMPFCLLPLVDLIKKQRIRSLPLAIFTGLMFQTHIFSSVLLVLIYLLFFSYLFFYSSEKIRLLKELSLSIFLFFLLTLNVWSSLFELYSGQKILPPFVNYSMHLSTITWQSVYMLLMPFPLFILLLVQFYVFWQKKESWPMMSKLILFVESIFLILSSNLIPWHFLITNEIKIAQIIQFPFRFFIPATILLLVNFGLLLKEGMVSIEKAEKALKWFFPFSLIQTVILLLFTLSFWQTENDYLQSGMHVTIHETNTAVVKSSFFDKNKQKALQLVEKATPDYLPVYYDEGQNNYKLYKKGIIDENKKFVKEVKGDSLIVKWQGDKNLNVTIPIIKYRETKLELNGKKLSEKEIELSSLGVIKVKQQEGDNQLRVSYEETALFKMSLWLTAFTWLGCVFKILFVKAVK
ncbi:hypothetical protein ACWN8V_09020 [Vagococcus elongatus]|uniref:Membrane protein 6-pyruvoyl-tetrahydropterin synthase-related domain-containing protein n=1 Tax=Vagococcus elongatus TaxID=180344 RepID=A0A430ASP3_9ENTE|nr:hypothetical protein [Vagococcus elongatus]RSU11056.1 hypothetical protein CBF29_08830 [Vagococcus elongatus]